MRYIWIGDLMRSLPFIVGLSLVIAAGCGPSPAVRHAQSLVDHGDYRGASQFTEGELAKHPDDAGLHRIRQRALLGMGDPAAAVADYRAWRSGHAGIDDLPALRTMALTTIWQAVRSSSLTLKVEAIQAIERLELESLADEVGRAMGDDSDQVAAAAAVAVLSSFGQAPDVADQMLHSDDPVARAIALEGIGRKAGKHAAETLRPLAADPDPRVRAVAATYLGALADGADTQRLFNLATDPDATVRAAAVRGLARGGRGDRALLSTPAKAALADESLAVRLAGVALIERAGGRSALAALLSDPDPMVAATAARGAGDRAKAVLAIDRALASNEVSIRIGAVNLLAAAVTREVAISRATAALADRSPNVVIAAARALAYLDQRAAALTALAAIATVATHDSDDRASAAAELARLGDARGAPILVELYAATDPNVRHTVIAAHLGAGAITPALWSGLADDQGATRLDAAITILTLAAH
jgi:HEAT repeat protein